MDARYLIGTIILGAGSLAAACVGGVPSRYTYIADSPSASQPASQLAVTSPAFADGARIPTEHATISAGGGNVSVPLQWMSPPEGTRSLAIEVIDLHPSAREWVHWLVADIPPNVRQLSAGASGAAMPPGALELVNGFGSRGWGGPQPPAGTGPHEYRITVLALDTDSLGLTGDSDLSGFRSAAGGHVLASASLLGSFER